VFDPALGLNGRLIEMTEESGDPVQAAVLIGGEPLTAAFSRRFYEFCREQIPSIAQNEFIL